MLVKELFLDLVINVALYSLAAGVVGRMMHRFDGIPPIQYEMVIGAVLGLTAVIGMLIPVQVAPGVVFDGRAIAVAAAGLFGGPAGAAAAMAPPMLYRLELGGAGVLPGVINIALAGMLGAAVRWFALRRAPCVGARHVIVASCLLPLASYAAFPFFPTAELAWSVFQNIGAALAVAMPAGLLVLGLYMLDEQKRYQLVLDLRSKESLFDAMHADIPAMLFQRTLTPDGLPKFRYISQSSKRLLDRTPEEMYRNPKNFIEAIHPDDRETFLATIHAAEKDGVLPHHEYRSISRDGFIRWLRVNAAATEIEGEWVWNGVTIDITNLKRAEQEQSELAQVFRDSCVAIVRTDKDFNVCHFNAAAERLYGYSAEEAIGMPAARFRPPERVEAMGIFLDNIQAKLKPDSIRTTALHKTGRRIPVRLDFSPMFDETGRIAGWATMCIDMTEQESAEQELQRLATTDALTRLPNRRSFQDQGAQEIARARRYNRPLSIIMADIDHFKYINDTFGHAAGDEVLRSAADIFRHTLRTSGDTVSRLGGEEFAIILPECNQDGAALLAERLRISISTMSVIHEGAEVSVRCSFGVAEWHPTDERIETVLSRADDALYAAKSGGRDQVAVASRPEIALSMQRLRDHAASEPPL